jgi:hypothetical protein
MPGQRIVAYANKYLARWPGFNSWVVQHSHLIKGMQLFSTSGLIASLMLQAHIATGGVLHLPRLQQLSCDFSPKGAVRLLAVLPCSLTGLHLAPESRQEEDAGGVEVLANALAQMNSLMCLQLGRHCCSSKFLLALRELTCLTQLKLCDQYTALKEVSAGMRCVLLGLCLSPVATLPPSLLPQFQDADSTLRSISGTDAWDDGLHVLLSFFGAGRWQQDCWQSSTARPRQQIAAWQQQCRPHNMHAQVVWSAHCRLRAAVTIMAPR